MEKLARKALNLIREKGWSRAGLENRGTYCLVGALACAAGWGTKQKELQDCAYDVVNTPTGQLVRRIIIEKFPEYGNEKYVAPYNALWKFNDSTLGGLADVEMVLEHAALLEDLGEQPESTDVNDRRSDFDVRATD